MTERTEKREQEEHEEEKEEQKPESYKADADFEIADCPDCDLPVRADKLGSHRFRAHGVERRKKQTPTAPEKKTGEKRSSAKEEEKPERKEPTGLLGAWKR